jgi:hypothetical protein
MDLNSIVFTVLFFFLAGLVLVVFVSFLAYKFRNKQAIKSPLQNSQTQEFLYQKPVSVPVQYYQLPIQQFQQQQYHYNINQKPVQSYRSRVSPYQVYTN